MYTIDLSMTIQLVETCSQIVWYNTIEWIVCLALITILWHIYTMEYLRQKTKQKKIIYFPFCGDVSISFHSESYILGSNLEFDIHNRGLNSVFLSLLSWEWAQKQFHSDLHYWSVNWQPRCEGDNLTIFFYYISVTHDIKLPLNN
jgi:hypothetical protein